MTGMPGFEKTLTTTQMWQVSVLMANADKAPKAVMDSLTATLPAPLPASVSSPMKK
jgi:mono/diheme cytochrome c family protein